jgi:hypothetical protein
MKNVDRKLGLLQDIARLRRVQGRLPGDTDLAIVRARLEQALGDTVSQRLAARFLGVSHTALRRWIEGGDLSLVHNESGRAEVHVPQLIELHERVAERQRGRRRGHVLEPVLLEGRERARTLPLDDLVATAEPSTGGHDSADRRALAYHRAVAQRLDRRMVGEALHRVLRWRDEGKLDPRYADQWERLLRAPLAEIKRKITDESPQGRDLRQNSPLAGMLSEPERRRILEASRL